MSHSFTVPVEPSVLQWARESIGFSVADVVKKLNISERLVKAWESGTSKPTYAQLEKLASVYKRPITAFLLKEKPDEPPLPEDFRMHPSAESKPLSPKMLLAVRKARWLQYTAIQLRKELGKPIIPFSFTASLSHDPENVAQRTRKEFGLNETVWSVNGDYERRFEAWRSLLESKGVLVFQLSMHQKEIRGFSLPDGELPAIVIKRFDAPAAKMFTLFHELGHLLLKQSGICDLRERIAGKSSSWETATVEKFCNHFAGAFLVPQSELLSHPVVQHNRGIARWAEGDLLTIARAFHVSKEVILRRLLYCGLTTPAYYKMKHDEWASRSKEPKPFGKKNEVKRTLQERGREYVSMVFEAYNKGALSDLDVADYLDVKLDKIPEVKDAL